MAHPLVDRFREDERPPPRARVDDARADAPRADDDFLEPLERVLDARDDVELPDRADEDVLRVLEPDDFAPPAERPPDEDLRDVPREPLPDEAPRLDRRDCDEAALRRLDCFPCAVRRATSLLKLLFWPRAVVS
jgi:hypothetical protein